MSNILDAANVHRTVLANGLTVLVYRNTAAPVAAVNTYVRAGYFDEPDAVVGIAHVLEHMYFKGTEKLGVGEIAKATKAAGGYLNAHTIYDHTSYYAVLPARGFDEGLAIQADAYAHSVIDAGELARELEVIIQEAMRKEDNAGAVTTETLYSLLHERHRIRRCRIGRPAELRKLTRDQLLEFYRNFYTPSNTVLAIAGDVDPDATLARARELYGAVESHEPVRTPGPLADDAPEFRYREIAGDVEVTHAEIGWRGVPILHPDAPALDLAASVLGSGRASRLFRAVRDRGLAGSAGAHNYTPREVGVFMVSSQGRPDRALDAMRAMWSQVAELRDGRAADDEVTRAQQLFASRWARHLDGVEGQAAHLAEWESLGGWALGDEYYDRFMSLGPPDITRVARKYLVPAEASIVVYRPSEATIVAPDAAAMLALLRDATAARLPDEERRSAPALMVQSAPSLARVDAQVRVYELPSGVPLLLRARTGSPIVHLGVYARAGAVYEPEEVAGITALAARTATRGTRTRSALQIADESERLGGSIVASVSSESAGWSMSVPRGNVVPAIELLADVVQHASLDDDRIEGERTAMIAELSALRDDMYRYPMRLMNETAYAGHPYANPAGGTEESLRTLSAATVRGWFGRELGAAPYVIAMVGDFDPDATAAALASAFAELKMASRDAIVAPEWTAHGIERIEARDKSQSAIALAFPSVGRGDAGRHAAHVLSSVVSGLGGRFFEELRDKRSLAYTVHAFSAEQPLSGMFVSYIATSPEKEAEARDGLLEQFALLRDTPVTEEEVSRARRYLLGMHDIRQERGGAVLGDILDAWMFGSLSELEETVPAIEAVTADSILELARSCFDPARVVQGIVRGSPAR